MADWNMRSFFVAERVAERDEDPYFYQDGDDRYLQHHVLDSSDADDQACDDYYWREGDDGLSN